MNEEKEIIIELIKSIDNPKMLEILKNLIEEYTQYYS